MAKVVMISEIFKVADDIPDYINKIAFLRSQSSPLMRIIVEGAYHPNIRWLLPTGRISYRPALAIDAFGGLHRESQRFYLFIQHISNPETAQQIPQWRREKLFQAVLETVHKDDAELLLSVKDKRLNYPSLTYDLFREAFPDWLPVRQGIQIPPRVESEGVVSELTKFFQEKAEVQKPPMKPKRICVDTGKKWYNDGKVNIRYLEGEQPANFTKGLLRLKNVNAQT